MINTEKITKNKKLKSVKKYKQKIRNPSSGFSKNLPSVSSSSSSLFRSSKMSFLKIYISPWRHEESPSTVLSEKSLLSSTLLRTSHLDKNFFLPEAVNFLKKYMILLRIYAINLKFAKAPLLVLLFVLKLGTSLDFDSTVFVKLALLRLLLLLILL